MQPSATLGGAKAATLVVCHLFQNELAGEAFCHVRGDGAGPPRSPRNAWPRKRAGTCRSKGCVSRQACAVATKLGPDRGWMVRRRALEGRPCISFRGGQGTRSAHRRAQLVPERVELGGLVPRPEGGTRGTGPPRAAGRIANTSALNGLPWPQGGAGHASGRRGESASAAGSAHATWLGLCSTATRGAAAARRRHASARTLAWERGGPRRARHCAVREPRSRVLRWSVCRVRAAAGASSGACARSSAPRARRCAPRAAF